MRPHDGTLLVASQFTLLFLLAVTTNWSELTLAPLLLFAAAMLLAGWAILIMRPGHFNVRPTIKIGATLITHGPYRHIRHPMYASLLLIGLGLLLITWSWLRMACYLGLWLVLILKLRFEEKLLVEHFPSYSHYQKRSRGLFPWF